MKWIALALFLIGVALIHGAFRLDPHASFQSGTFIWMLFKFFAGVGCCVVALVLFLIAVFIAI